jgi:hypothetical protein
MQKLVSVLFIAQKMLSRASQSHPFTLASIQTVEKDRAFSYFQANMAFNGCAVGELGFHAKSLKNVSATLDEKGNFMKEIASFL